MRSSLASLVGVHGGSLPAPAPDTSTVRIPVHLLVRVPWSTDGCLLSLLLLKEIFASHSFLACPRVSFRVIEVVTPFHASGTWKVQPIPPVLWGEYFGGVVFGFR